MDIPLKFLLESSRAVIGEYELSRLNHAANLRRELRAVVEQIIDNTAEARFARWLLDHGEELGRTLTSASVDAFEEAFDSGESAKGERITETCPARGLRVAID